MKIRDDFIGAIYINQKPYFAGDEIPDGANISPSHLAKPEMVDSFDDPPADAPSNRASKAVWKKFLAGQGIDFSEQDTLAELRARWEG